jgi:hypothetical protein
MTATPAGGLLNQRDRATGKPAAKYGSARRETADRCGSASSLTRTDAQEKQAAQIQRPERLDLRTHSDKKEHTMRKYFVVAGAIAALAVPSAALADVTNNPSTKDSYGYATANANRLVKDAGGHGIGSYRSESTGAEVSNLAVHGAELYPDWITDQGAFGPISNNGKRSRLACRADPGLTPPLVTIRRRARLRPGFASVASGSHFGSVTPASAHRPGPSLLSFSVCATGRVLPQSAARRRSAAMPGRR